VYKVIEKDEKGIPVADKLVAIKSIFPTVTDALVLNEICFLRLLNGRNNVVGVKDFWFTNYSYYIVFDYFPHQPVETYMFSMKMLDIKYYMFQLLKALSYLETLGVVHRDIKQSNFLYNPETKAGVLIDFGLAEITTEKITELHLPKRKKDDNEVLELYKIILDQQTKIGNKKIGTEGFMSLDQLMMADYQSHEVDLWSAGVIFLEFLVRKHPFFRNPRIRKEKRKGKGNEKELVEVEYLLIYLVELSLLFGKKLVKKVAESFDFEVDLPNYLPEEPIKWKDVVIHEEYDEVAGDLLDKLLKLKPNDRITAKKALEHPFFDEIRDKGC